MPPTRSKVDWHRVELHYRAGNRQLDAIGTEFGITKGRISQVAKKHGWTQDLRVQIAARARAKADRQAADLGLAERELNDPAKRQARLEAESLVVEEYAASQTRVVMGHRIVIARASRLLDRLFAEFEEVNDASSASRALPSAIARVIDLVPSPAQRSMLSAIKHRIDKVLTLKAQVNQLYRLTQVVEKLVQLERKAWGLRDVDESPAAPPAMTDAERMHRVSVLVNKAQRRQEAGHKVPNGSTASWPCPVCKCAQSQL